MDAFIPLSNGGLAVIDSEDMPLVSGMKWRRGSRGYVECSVRLSSGRPSILRMHQLIADAGRNPEIDHRNLNRLDNRRENLRPCSTSQNQANRKPLPHASRFKGVTPSKTIGRFEAQIWHRRKRFYLGTFATEELAAVAYDTAAVRLFGEFARLNFPAESK